MISPTHHFPPVICLHLCVKKSSVTFIIKMCNVGEDVESVVNFGGDFDCTALVDELVQAVVPLDLPIDTEENFVVPGELVNLNLGCGGDQPGNDETTPPLCSSKRSKSPDDLVSRLREIWYEGIADGSASQEESLMMDSASKILERVVNTECAFLETLQPTLNQVTESTETFKETLAVKESEIASLKLINFNQKTEIDDLNTKIKERQTAKTETVKPALQSDKSLERLKSENAKVMKMNKSCVYKEKAMTQKIIDLQRELQKSERHLQQISEEQKILGKKKIESHQKELEEILEKLAVVKRNAEESEKAAVEMAEEWGRQNLEKSINDANEKFEETRELLAQWEGHLREREDCLKQNNSILVARNRLLTVLEARLQNKSDLVL